MDEVPAESRSRLRHEVRVVGLVGAGFFLSGFYLIVLPPVFPLLAAEFTLSNTALGVLMTTYAVASGLTQIPIGILVDRIGARWILIVGAAICAAVVTAIGFATSYVELLLLVTVLGIAMCVFQPADYAILSATVERRRLGRAFSLHTFGGNLGIMAAPLSIGLTAQWWGWRTAMFAAGGFGFVILIALLFGHRLLQSDVTTPAAAATLRTGSAETKDEKTERSLLLSAPFLMFLLFFIVMSMGGAGVRTFTVTAMVEFHDASLASANAALTAFYLASAIGILIGGVIADRTERHDLAVFAAVLPGAFAFAVIGGIVMPVVMLTSALFAAGLGHGILRPSRDKMVQMATPRGSIGRTFGFITTGAYCGNALTPALFGWIVDLGQPRVVFWLISLLILLQGGVILAARQIMVRRQRTSDRPAAR